jgi:cytochrome c oxidase assembly protein subunit 15
VQFDHRVLALASTAAVATTLVLSRRGNVWAILPPSTKLAVSGMVGMVGVQVSLGVSTLLLYVPLELAAAHQLGSLVLLTFATAAAHSLKGVALKSAVPVALAGVGVVTAPALALLAFSDKGELAK